MQVGISTWMSTASWVIVTSATNCGMLWSLPWRLWVTTLYHQRKPRWDQGKRWKYRAQTKPAQHLFIFTQWNTVYHIFITFWPNNVGFCYHYLSGGLYAHMLPWLLFMNLYINIWELPSTWNRLTTSEHFLILLPSIPSDVWRGECVRQVDSVQTVCSCWFLWCWL